MTLPQEKRIFFAHQSVGGNIIDGLAAWLRKTELPEFNIIDELTESSEGNAFLLHSLIGKNTDPVSKIDAFTQFIIEHDVLKLDIAIFKLCYIDINRLTDIDKLFGYYKDKLSGIQESFPGTKFLFCTVPVRTEPRGIINALRKMLGNVSSASYDNLARFRFNQLIRDTFKENTLDIARAESTTVNNRYYHSKLKRTRYDKLLPEYTNDGGHLNSLGQKYIAKYFYNQLCSI